MNLITEFQMQLEEHYPLVVDQCNRFYAWGIYLACWVNSVLSKVKFYLLCPCAAALELPNLNYTYIGTEETLELKT